MSVLAQRITALHGWRRGATAVACGGVMALGHSPVSWPLGLFLALPVLAWLFEDASGWRGGFRLGWLAGSGYFAGTLFWIVEPFLVDPEIYGWMAPFALVGMAGGLALFWGAAFALARALGGGPAARLVALACLWVAAGYARSHLFGGFPWALPAYAWVETPVMQTVSLVGPHGLGFLTLLAGLLLGLRRFWALAVSALLVAMGWSYGAWQLAQPLPEREEPFVVRVVQPNATQSLKWVPELQALYYRRLMELTAAPGAVQPDAVIWPETAVPYLLGETPEFEAEAAAAAGPDTALILGIRRRSFGPEGEHWYNSLAVLGPGGAVEARYDKHHLVPFGEFIPLSGAIARLGLPQLTGLTATGFSAGPGPRLVDVPGVPPFLPLICYEAVFPHQMRAPGGRPDWIVQLTNDAWFGRIAGPYQHLAQARARAIEQGLPLVRAANTGISAVIDARGRVLVQLELGVSGRLDIALPSAAVHTFYGLFGDWPAILAILVTFALTVATILGGNSTRYRR